LESQEDGITEDLHAADTLSIGVDLIVQEHDITDSIGVAYPIEEHRELCCYAQEVVPTYTYIS
jgi:hypothetical protein